MNSKTSPYWADKVAQKIIASGNFQPYWVDDMKTPSGRVHIGSVRAVLTHALIHQALMDAGVSAEFSYVLEDQDPMDKVPAYLDHSRWKEHVGKQLYEVPSPEEGYDSYGHRWGQEYIEIFNHIGVHPKIIWGSELYRSGKLNAHIELCLNSRDQIAQIYFDLYDQRKPDDWYPLSPRCEACHKILSTRVTNWDATNKQIDYICDVETMKDVISCGHSGTMSPFDGNAKLPWKVEWPVKWDAIGVTVEGAGKDHMSDGGSHDFAKLMCERVLKTQVPFAFMHEFFLVGGKKMSSSKGVGSSAKEISEIVPPHIMRYLIVRTRYNRAINLDPNSMMIPDAFDEYDAAAQEYWKDDGDPLQSRIYQLSQVSQPPAEPHYAPRFRDIAIWMQHPEMDLQQQFAKLKGSQLTELETKILESRLQYAKIWVAEYAPDEFRVGIASNTPEAIGTFTTEQKEFVTQILQDRLSKQWQPDELQQHIYTTAKDTLGAKKGFQSLYRVLNGKTYGPRAGWLLLAADEAVLQERIKSLQNLK